ncbi:MAG: hypothetical protein JF595_03260 [Sphingomonadales bacterium]|nr:hypothetical protein [Sphingomonadales bacterium]
MAQFDTSVPQMPDGLLLRRIITHKKRRPRKGGLGTIMRASRPSVIALAPRIELKIGKTPAADLPAATLRQVKDQVRNPREEERQTEETRDEVQKLAFERLRSAHSDGRLDRAGPGARHPAASGRSPQ